MVKSGPIPTFPPNSQVRSHRIPSIGSGRFAGQMTSTTKVSRVDLGGCGPLQKVISEFDKNNGDGNRDSRPSPHGT
jgi:hypothetical protein